MVNTELVMFNKYFSICGQHNFNSCIGILSDAPALSLIFIIVSMISSNKVKMGFRNFMFPGTFKESILLL